MHIFYILEDRYLSAVDDAHFLYHISVDMKDVESCYGDEMSVNAFFVLLSHLLWHLPMQDLFNLMIVDWNVSPHLSRKIFLRIESEIISRYYSILFIGHELGWNAKKICFLEIGELQQLLRDYLRENPIFWLNIYCQKN